MLAVLLSSWQRKRCPNTATKTRVKSTGITGIDTAALIATIITTITLSITITTITITANHRKLRELFHIVSAFMLSGLYWHCFESVAAYHTTYRSFIWC